MERYERRALLMLNQPRQLGPDGPAALASEFQTPYRVYEALIAQHTGPGMRLLDVCCGDGRHSLAAAASGCQITVSDIAPANLAAARLRAERAGFTIETVVANAEQLPFPDGHFDLVTCAGSLSYVDLELFLAQVTRILRPEGAFIFVDSLNHNPVYRLNRWIHYLRGHRSRSTLLRMPTITTVRRIGEVFPGLQVSYHGIFSFLALALRPLGRERAARWLDAADIIFSRFQHHAFKVVGIGRKPIHIR
jgi:ubiquinone/menaquinone biosynthesis C-methylase UbiE